MAIFKTRRVTNNHISNEATFTMTYIDTLSALPPLREREPPVGDGFAAQSLIWSFDVFFVIILIKLASTVIKS